MTILFVSGYVEESSCVLAPHARAHDDHHLGRGNDKMCTNILYATLAGK